MFMPRFTAAAERVLRSAEEWALAEGRPVADATHLLAALAEEESRASDIVVRLGVSLDQLIETAQAVAALSDDSAAALRPTGRSQLLDEIVDAARRKAGRSGGQTETGTEHLLWGLVDVPSVLSRKLSALGLSPLAIGELMGHTEESSDVPIPTTLQLQIDLDTERERLRALRAIDAAANRAREGLRVAEDFTRFVLDDAHLTERLKASRHRLTAALRRFDPATLFAARDTRHDVGTEITTAAEYARGGTLDVVQAAFKRTQEALRTLEEFSKTINPGAAITFEQSRYEMYTLEQAVCRSVLLRDRLKNCVLYLLITRDLCRLDLETVVKEAVLGGVSLVQLREKDLEDRELLALARRVRELTRRYPALFIMNDRPDLAVLADADGVHVGQTELSVAEARQIVGVRRLIGVSTHDLEQARQAVLDGADYLGVGPTFPSTTKAFDDFAGLEFVRQMAAEIKLPWFAIGGITAENVAEVVAAGAERVAVSGAICGSRNPRQAAADVRGRLVQVD